MDFINKAFAQAADVFKGLTPGTRIAAGLLAAAIMVALVYLFQYQATTGNELLLGGRPFVGDELTRAEAAFAKAGLAGSEVVDGSRIRIPHGKKDQYLAALAESNALPADFYKYLDEAAASDNPFVSNQSLAFKRSTAKQKELALIISRMRGIAAATVHYDEASKGGPRGEKFKTAMVTIKPLAGELDDSQIKAIRNIVASAYAGLDKANVSITDTESGHSYGGASSGGIYEGESAYTTQKDQLERNFKQKIQDQLRWIPGAIVNVNVELSPELHRTSQEVKLDAKPIAVSLSESQKDSTTKGGGPGGRPGAEPNGVGGNRALEISQSASAPESTTNESKSEQKNMAGHIVNVTNTAGLTPTKVTAAIAIPGSHFVKIWQQRNPTPAGQTAKAPETAQIDLIKQDTLKKVEDTVRNLIPPVVQGGNPYPYITVAAYDDLPTSPIAAPTTTERASAWLADNWRGIGMLLVGLVSLAVLRSAVRGTSAPLSPATTAAETPRVEEEEPAEEEPAQTNLRRKFDATGSNLKSDLQLLVKEDPDAAVSILRNWIGDAA